VAQAVAPPTATLAAAAARAALSNPDSMTARLARVAPAVTEALGPVRAALQAGALAMRELSRQSAAHRAALAASAAAAADAPDEVPAPCSPACATLTLRADSGAGAAGGRTCAAAVAAQGSVGPHRQPRDPQGAARRTARRRRVSDRSSQAHRALQANRLAGQRAAKARAEMCAREAKRRCALCECRSRACGC
jgi:hypothetical protein